MLLLMCAGFAAVWTRTRHGGRLHPVAAVALAGLAVPGALLHRFGRRQDGTGAP